MRVSSQRLTLKPSNYATYPENKETNENYVDDWDHKCHKREAHFFEGDAGQGLTRPYHKRNRLSENVHPYRRVESQSSGTWKSHNVLSHSQMEYVPCAVNTGVPDATNALSTTWNEFLVPNAQSTTYKRCVDFEEKGFCLRGDMCPMEHGVDCIVVEDVQSLSQFNLPVSLPAGQGALPAISSPYVPLKPVHAKSSNPRVSQDGDNYEDDMYDPDQPLFTNNTLDMSASFSAFNRSNAYQTESFLEVDPPTHRQYTESYDKFDECPIKNAATSKIRPELHEKSVLNDKCPQVDKPWLKPHKGSLCNVPKPSQKAVRTLFVSGIPEKDNKRDALISHFRKFGEVIGVFIPITTGRAFVQFSRREEAEIALKSPDAVMGNRFIKIRWANRDVKCEDSVSHSSAPEKGKENPRLLSGENSKASFPVSQVPVYDQPKPVIPNCSKLPPKPKKLESIDILLEEIRKKQEILDERRNEFRCNLEKIGKEEATISDHAKSGCAISSPRVDVITENVKSNEQVVTRFSSSRNAIRHSTPFAGNRFKLDNRPTAFKIVSPLPAGLTNACTLEEFFSSYGDISSIKLKESDGEFSAQISFTTRRAAEKAFLHGNCWKGHKLQFIWLTPNNSTGEIASSNSRKFAGKP